MFTATELQAKIIDLVSGITDLNQLTAIHGDLAAKAGVDDVESTDELPWKGSIVNLREQLSFEEIIKEQGRKSITYDELRSLADGIEWDCTLDELLEALD